MLYCTYENERKFELPNNNSLRWSLWKNKLNYTTRVITKTFLLFSQRIKGYFLIHWILFIHIYLLVIIIPIERNESLSHSKWKRSSPETRTRHTCIRITVYIIIIVCCCTHEKRPPSTSVTLIRPSQKRCFKWKKKILIFMYNETWTRTTYLETCTWSMTITIDVHWQITPILLLIIMT